MTILCCFYASCMSVMNQVAIHTRVILGLSSLFPSSISLSLCPKDSKTVFNSYVSKITYLHVSFLLSTMEKQPIKVHKNSAGIVTRITLNI